MLFVAAGSAAAAAAVTKERIVASFIVAASWLAEHAEPVLGTARLYECLIGGAYRFEQKRYSGGISPFRNKLAHDGQMRGR
jgi:hypothetical protein